MARQRAILLSLAFLGFAAAGQEAKKAPPEKAPAEFKVPPEAARQENPEKPTPSSLAQGKKLFGFDCAMCHGAQGDGKGDLADQMKLKLRDYRDPAALKNRTDGELFYVILKGKAEMVGEEGRLKPKEIWDVVNFVRSLARSDSPDKSKEDKPKEDKPKEEKPKPEKPQ